MIVYDVKCTNLTHHDSALLREVITEVAANTMDEVVQEKMPSDEFADHVRARAMYNLAVASAFTEIAVKVGRGHRLTLADIQVKEYEKGSDGFPVIVVSVGVDPKNEEGISTTEAFKELLE